jgi:hypothetical protein
MVMNKKGRCTLLPTIFIRGHKFRFKKLSQNEMCALCVILNTTTHGMKMYSNFKYLTNKSWYWWNDSRWYDFSCVSDRRNCGAQLEKRTIYFYGTFINYSKSNPFQSITFTATENVSGYAILNILTNYQSVHRLQNMPFFWPGFI